jgi:hypothetical protein
MTTKLAALALMGALSVNSMADAIVSAVTHQEARR